jgi:integrase
MRFVTQTRSRDRALSATETRLYLEGIYQSNIRRKFKLGLHIILLTLVRKSELLNAGWEDVEFETGEWTIPAEHSKDRQAARRLSRSPDGRPFRELKSLSSASVLILPGRGSLTRTFASNALNKSTERPAQAFRPRRLREVLFSEEILSETRDQALPCR